MLTIPTDIDTCLLHSIEACYVVDMYNPLHFSGCGLHTKLLCNIIAVYKCACHVAYDMHTDIQVD